MVKRQSYDENIAFYKDILQSDKADRDSVVLAYHMLYEIQQNSPFFADKILDVFQIGLQTALNDEIILENVYKYLYEIVRDSPELTDKVLATYQIALQSDKNGIKGISQVYDYLSKIAKSKSQFSDKALETFQSAMQFDTNNKDTLKHAYTCLFDIVRAKPELADMVFKTFQSAIKSDKNDKDIISHAYNQLFDILTTQPQLTDKVFEICQENLVPDKITDSIIPLQRQRFRARSTRKEPAYEQLQYLYDMLYDNLYSKPELADKIFDSFQTALEHEKHNATTLSFTYAKLLDILKYQPQYADNVLETIQVALKSERIYPHCLYDTYLLVCGSLKEKPYLADKALEIFKMAMQSDKNDSQCLRGGYIYLLDIVEDHPQLVNEVFDILQVGLKNNQNDNNTLRIAYSTLVSIMETEPKLADKFLDQQHIDISIGDSAYNVLGVIVNKRADLISQLAEKYPDINLDTLQSASRIVSDLSLESFCISDLYNQLTSISAADQKKVERVLTTKQLETEDKQTLHHMLIADKLPIKDLAEFNPNAYQEIKEYMLSKECEAHPELTKEEVYERNKEWLMASAVYVAVLYKKDYKRYFDVVEKYNKELPRLKSLMPEVYQEVTKKTIDLTTKLEVVQKERKKYDTREAGLTPDDVRYQVMRAKYDELGIMERGIKGNLQGVQSYIDYEKLTPIGMEKATAWMQYAVKAKDREGLLNKINSSLLSTNPNILACGKSGQPFIRLDHKTATQSENADELMIISSRWDIIPIEIKAKGFKDIVEAAKSYKFNGENVEFMQANGKYIDNQETYDEAEAIYEKGRLTPSRFERTEHYSADGSWRCYIADKDDPRPLYAGGKWSDRAKCCQSYGDAGSSCAVDSVLNPDSGCVIFERKITIKDENGNDQEVWEMQGCSWCYEVQSGEYKKLIFDNVEINDNYHAESPVINEAFDSLVEDLSKDNYLEIRMGYSPDLGLRDDKVAAQTDGLPHGYSGYSDAEHQYILKINEDAKPERLPEIMVVGMDLSKHRKGMEEVAQEAFSDVDRALEIPENAKGMVLINRENEVLGYVIWTEKENEEHKGETINNWIYDMAVSPKYQGQSGSLKLLTEMMKHVQKTGSTWGGELRDTTSLRYMTIMSDKVENGEIAGINKDFRGRAKVDLEIVKLERTMQDGSKVYRCVFKPLTPEETEQRLSARKVEQSLGQTRDKLESKQAQCETSQKETIVISTQSSGITKYDYGHDNR